MILKRTTQLQDKKLESQLIEMKEKPNHCLKTLSNCGISESSDFASRIKDTYLTFILIYFISFWIYYT